MRDSATVLVTNTTPLIAMTAAIGSLDAFRFLYGRVIVPFHEHFGVLLKARQLGFPVSMPDALRCMRERGIWLSDGVVHFALAHGQ